jgi:hypothetical protein
MNTTATNDKSSRIADFRVIHDLSLELYFCHIEVLVATEIVIIAVLLEMNQKGFCQAYGENLGEQ